MMYSAASASRRLRRACSSVSSSAGDGGVPARRSCMRFACSRGPATRLLPGRKSGDRKRQRRGSRSEPRRALRVDVCCVLFICSCQTWFVGCP